MFPTSLQHPYAPRGRRRGRNDPNSRDFICPCGKSYLSYPALFTHIKIKHNGRAPGQIIKPKTESLSKRGRPRQKQVYDSESDTNDIAANCIDRLCDFVTDFDRSQDNGRLKQLYMKDPFYSIYVNFNLQQQEPRYNQRQDLYEQYCDNVFCEVIAEVNKRINQPYYIDVIMVFFMLLSHCINDSLGNKDKDKDFYCYQQQLQPPNQQDYNSELQQEQMQAQQLLQPQNDLFQKRQNKKDSVYQEQPRSRSLIEENRQERMQPEQDSQGEEELFRLKDQPIRNVVNFINVFILNYYPKYCEEYKLGQFEFFKDNNAKRFIELFFHWLTMKKYVCYKVKINKNY